MSVTFSIQGQQPDYERRDNYLNVSNANACDLLRWLGVDFDDTDLCGQISAPMLARRCRERLRLIADNIDPAIPPRERVGDNGARFVYCGRSEGYLHDRCEELLVLAEAAGDGHIVYG
jgi:hypothetical protein